MLSAPPEAPPIAGVRTDLWRLQARHRRVCDVLARLRAIADSTLYDGGVPDDLQHAIRGLDHQRRAIERAVDDL